MATSSKSATPTSPDTATALLAKLDEILTRQTAMERELDALRKPAEVASPRPVANGAPVVNAPLTSQANVGTLDPATIREWARQKGIEVATRGRIPEKVISDYRAAVLPSTLPATAPAPQTPKATATAVATDARFTFDHAKGTVDVADGAAEVTSLDEAVLARLTPQHLVRLSQASKRWEIAGVPVSAYVRRQCAWAAQGLLFKQWVEAGRPKLSDKTAAAMVAQSEAKGFEPIGLTPRNRQTILRLLASIRIAGYNMDEFVRSL